MNDAGRPSRMEDMLKAVYPQQKKLHTLSRHPVLAGVQVVVLVVFHAIQAAVDFVLIYPLLAPAAAISAFALFQAPSIQAFFWCVLVCCAERQGTEFAQARQGTRELFQLLSFVKRSVLFQFRIDEIPTQAYFTPAEHEVFVGLRPLSFANYNPVARLFILTPRDPTRPLGAWKGFVPMRAPTEQATKNLPKSFRERGAHLIAPGYVFADVPPARASAFDRFRVAHELGHCSTFGLRSKCAAGNAAVAVISLWVVMLSLGTTTLTMLGCAAIYSCLRLYELRRAHRFAVDETLADTIAMQALWEGTELDRSLKVHEKFLERNRRISGAERRKRLRNLRLFTIRRELKWRFAVAYALQLRPKLVLLLSIAPVALLLWESWHLRVAAGASFIYPLLLLVGFLYALLLVQTVNTAMRAMLDETLAWAKSLDWQRYAGLPPDECRSVAMYESPPKAPRAAFFVSAPVSHWGPTYGALVAITAHFAPFLAFYVAQRKRSGVVGSALRTMLAFVLRLGFTLGQIVAGAPMIVTFGVIMASIVLILRWLYFLVV